MHCTHARSQNCRLCLPPARKACADFPYTMCNKEGVTTLKVHTIPRGPSQARQSFSQRGPRISTNVGGCAVANTATTSAPFTKETITEPGFRNALHTTLSLHWLGTSCPTRLRRCRRHHVARQGSVLVHQRSSAGAMSRRMRHAMPRRHGACVQSEPPRHARRNLEHHDQARCKVPPS